MMKYLSILGLTFLFYACQDKNHLDDFISETDLNQIKNEFGVQNAVCTSINDSILILKDSSKLRIHQENIFLEKEGGLYALHPERIPHLKVPVRFSMIQATLDTSLVDIIRNNKNIQSKGDSLWITTYKKSYPLKWNGQCYSLEN